MDEQTKLTRREFLTTFGIWAGAGLSIAAAISAGAVVLYEEKIWPFSKAGTRAPFPHAASTGRVKAYTFDEPSRNTFMTQEARRETELSIAAVSLPFHAYSTHDLRPK